MNFSILGLFGAGLLTFFSPCVLPVAPILTATLLGPQPGGRWGRLLTTLWFSLGFMTAFVAMGMGIASIASAFGLARPLILIGGGIFLALFGLRMMDVIHPGKYFEWMTRSFHLPDFTHRLPRGVRGLFLGVLFGASWTPCVGPILGGVLTFVASQEHSATMGGAMLAVFALGIALPFIALGAASEYIQPLLVRMRALLPRIEYAAGVGLLAFGVYMLNQGRLQIPAANAEQGSSADLIALGEDGSVHRPLASSAKPSQMLFFYSSHCPICHAMQGFLPDFEKSCASTGFDFVRVNVDYPENEAIASRFNVQAVPTIAVLGREGRELVHLVGYQTEARLKDAARTVTQVACNATPVPEKLDFSPLSPVQPDEGRTCHVGASC